MITDPDDLRERAEHILKDKSADNPETPLPEDIQTLVHDLEVHQIELEMQNEELRKTQKDLDASRERYFELYDLAPVGYFCVSESGLILEANLALTGLLGVSRKRLLGQPISRFIQREDQDIYYLNRKKLMNSGDPASWELRMLGKNVIPFWAQMEATAARDARGDQMFRIVLTDITERKFLEDKRKLTERLVLLLNKTDDLEMCMEDLTSLLKNWACCEAVGIRLQNEGDFPYYKTTGFPAAFVREESSLCSKDAKGAVVLDHSGKPVLQCMCGNVLSGRFDPEKPFFTEKGSFWTNGTTNLLASFTEAEQQTPMRSSCSKEGYESVALIPLRMGKQVFGLLQFNDHRPNRFTKDLINHFEELAGWISIALSRLKSENDYRILFMKMVDGFALHEIICDQQGEPVNYRFLAVNPAFERHTGLKAESIIGKTVLEVIPDLEPQWIEIYGQVAITGEPAHFEDYSSSLDKYFEVSAFRPALNQFVCIITDVTGRKLAELDKVNLEDRFRQAQKMESVGQLAGGVAHDFNNMLSVILGQTEIALNQVSKDEPLYESLTEIRKAGERSSELTGQLMAFARKQTIEPRILDLNETIENMLKMLRHLLGEGTTLDWKPGNDLLSVKMDPSQIDQIMANLCINAMDAVGDSGTVTIETEAITVDETYCEDYKGISPGEYVLLRVSDDGCGMDKETLARIFDPFFTTKAMGKGTGLGLATVYGIVKQNSGFVYAESQQNKGAVFTVFLPGYSERSQQNEMTPAKEQIVIDCGTILLVEDEPAILDVTKLMLEQSGYRVLATSSPEEAITILRENLEEIGILVTDVVMPKMNGLDLSRNLLAEKSTLKCLFMSGYTSDVIAHHGVLEGGVNFIQKPFRSKELTGKIQEILKG